MSEDLQKFVDKDQSKRIQMLEEKCTVIDAKITTLMAKIDTLTNLGKVIGIAAGLALGIDVAPMI
tara:strand:- start:162 stop:356 length:195 start_codon:yes stop_codon:yes gene_type:complete